MKNFYITLLFLFFLGSPLYAQMKVESPILDSVVKNNEGVRLFRNDRIYALQGDAIRVSGIVKPGENVKVFFDGEEYVGIVDKYGNWFVLFSINSTEDLEYIIEAQASKGGESSEKVPLLTIVIGEEPIEDIVEEKEKEDEVLIDKENGKDFLIGFLILVIIVLAWMLLSPKIIKS